ncbi:MAG: hypothetical protein ABSC21_16235 [Terriglobia bacterium]|jgi:hypothetical protein
MLTKQTYTMKCRETGYTARVNVIEVDDVPGHIIGVGEFPGVLSCDDGSVATTSTKDMFDYIKGSGKFHGYNVATFEDGSTLRIRYQGTATPEANGKTSRWEATCEFIKGTGRFEGIQGGGSFTGKRLASTPGAGAQYYIDYDLTYTLPSK